MAAEGRLLRSERRSQHLMHVDDDAIGVARSGSDEQVFHQPAVFLAAGLEPRYGAEVVQGRSERLAGLQPLQQFDRSEADTLVLDINHGAIVGLKGVFGFQLYQFIGPDYLKVSAEWADLAGDFAAHLAAGNGNNAADALADIAGGCDAADVGRKGEDIFGRKLRVHLVTRPYVAAAMSPATETGSGSPAGRDPSPRTESRP